MNTTATDARGMKVETITTPEGKATASVTLPLGTEKVNVIIPTQKKPASGQAAVIVKAGGTREIFRTSVPTDGGIEITLTESTKLEIVDNSKTFADVDDDAWFSADVQFSASRELLNGTSKNVFDPTGNMTRAMLVTVLARLDGQDTSMGESWATVGTKWAKENGISDGSSMSDSITREQLAIILYRYAKAEKSTGGISTFSDAGKVSVWANEAMVWAVENGIIKGINSNLNPTGNASRAEISTILSRYIKLIVN